MGPLFLFLLLSVVAPPLTLGQEVVVMDEAEPEKKENEVPNDPVGVTINVGYWVLVNDESSSQIKAKFIPWDTNTLATYGVINGNILNTVPGSPAQTLSNLYKSGSVHYLSSPLTIQTSAEFMDALRSQGRSLPLDLKLDLLRRVGGDMNTRYDKSISSPLVWYSPASWFETFNDAREDRSDDEIFSRLRTNDGSVGICRHIHRYLRDMAQALGLEACNISVDWRQSGSSGAHLLSAFKDPVSGKIFIQNYYDIIQLGQTNEGSARPIQEAVSQILSGSTATSTVEPADGNPSHMYLTDTGKLMLLGIEKASKLPVHPDQDVVIQFEQQNSYTGAFGKIPLNKRRNRDLFNQEYVFFGAQNLQSHPSLPYFKQGLVGIGLQEHYQFKAFRKENTRWLKTVDTRFDMGLQSTYRPQLYLQGALKQEQNQAETFLFMDLEFNRGYSIQSLNKKNTFQVGFQGELKWTDMIAFSGNKDGSHTSLPYNWMKPYLSVSRKISKNTGVGFKVSEVSQINATNLSTDALGIQHQFFTGEIELFSVGKQGFIRANDKLYVLPKGGLSARSNLEFMKKMFSGRKNTVSVVGSGTYGTNLKDSRDSWYKMKTFETGRIGLEYSIPFKSGKGALQMGSGVQYQSNTSTNTFDPIEMKNIQQFIDNPKGSSGWFYIRLTNIR